MMRLLRRLRLTLAYWQPFGTPDSEWQIDLRTAWAVAGNIVAAQDNGSWSERVK